MKIHYNIPDLNLPNLESQVQKFWESDGIFHKSTKGDSNEFVFYDGPPFANGLPHYGHLLTSFIKDVYARYHTMLDQKTERRFGWDCHGLPAEMEVQKELSSEGKIIQSRIDIEKYGIENFNNRCKQSVMKYSSEWERYIKKAGRWVDFKDDYRTMDLQYMESVIWGFKELYKKGLLYEDYRVMPYSWKCETPLSNFETRMDNSYREKISKTVTVKFELEDGRKMLVWTTTPWTLPSNLALALHQDIEYSEIFHNGENLIIASALLSKYDKELDGASLVKTMNGGDLLNLCYKPLFPFYSKASDQHFKVYHGDFVTVEDGTGIVHMAPGFGEDDQKLCKTNGIDVFCPIDDCGKFTNDIYGINANGEKLPLYNDFTIQTENLSAKFIQDQDLDIIAELYADRDVRKFYANTLTKNQTIDELKLYTDLGKKFGHTRMMVYETKSGEFVGIAGVDNVTLDSPEIQIGFTLHKKFWNKGYAFEIGSELLQHFGYAKISAYSHEENFGAHKVLEKLGFKKVGRKVYPRSGVERDFFIREASQNWYGTTFLNGRQVFDTEASIARLLAKRHAILKSEDYRHNYPHCWRTDTPLIYKAVPSWYVNVTTAQMKDENGNEIGTIRENMVKHNQSINWKPEHIRDGLFGKWLENARDWSITRNRYWGAPVPVWKCEEKIYVFGSISELEEFFEMTIKDLHRPFVDELKRSLYEPNDKKRKDFSARGWNLSSDPKDIDKQITRIADVLDCWFESGAMPFASVHYGFSEKHGEKTWFDFKSSDDTIIRKGSDNAKWFENHFPADFITEYVAQTRGWFYTLVVLGVAIFNKIPFKNCICHGVITGKDGQKLSKRLKNYPDPLLMFDIIGSDCMRWLMMSSQVVTGGDLQISEDGSDIRDIARLVVKPIWNAYTFFAMYANADNINAKQKYDSTNSMDIYILAKVKTLAIDVKSALDSYNTQIACKKIEDFIEIMNNWYIRRNKERFWRSKMNDDKISAYDTLYMALLDFSKITAPLLPFTSENIWMKLQGK